jgi:hypothetical protein
MIKKPVQRQALETIFIPAECPAALASPAFGMGRGKYRRAGVVS